jgi:DNA-binding PadR family transcriptional regulator
VLRKLEQATDDGVRLVFKDDDLDILEVLFRSDKKKQYDIERDLRKRGKPLAHSTVTGKLQRLGKCGFVEGTKEIDGFTYYELTPTGSSLLASKGRVKIEEAISYIEKKPEQYFELLTKFQPNLIERLKGVPPWFVTQLTPDLWAIYSVNNREQVRKFTIESAIAVAKGSEPKEGRINYSVQNLCVQRLEIEGKGVCLKQKTECSYAPSKIAQCPVLKNQLEKELERLEER